MYNYAFITDVIYFLSATYLVYLYITFRCGCKFLPSCQAYVSGFCFRSMMYYFIAFLVLKNYCYW